MATDRLRCVFDTNVLVSALLLPSSVPRRALDFVLDHGKVVLSPPVFRELANVLSREKLRRYVSATTVQRFLSSFARESEWVDPGQEIRACRDPRDDKFLSLAVSGKASYLITGDQDLSVLNPFQGIRILNPRSFLEEVRLT
ncbi:MAG: putative toxin-antitoxin system toxin component, PIN family [Acidobacteriaceae bacterium]|jgi:uncharacterized protein